jgi:hypothetical protein
MSRSFVLASLPALLLMLGASAPAGPLQRAFGNTIVSTYPDGRTAELWLEPSGDYKAMGRKHDPSSGHWKLSGDKLCLKQSRPFPAPFSFCTPLPVGESWTAKAVTGEAIRVRLLKGRGPGEGHPTAGEGS